MSKKRSISEKIAAGVDSVLHPGGDDAKSSDQSPAQDGAVAPDVEVGSAPDSGGAKNPVEVAPDVATGLRPEQPEAEDQPKSDNI